MSSSFSRTRLAAVVLPALILPFFGCLLYYGPLLGTPSGTIAYTITKIFTVAWPLVATAYLLGGLRLKERIGRFRDHFGSLSFGLTTGLVIAALGVLAFFFTPIGAAARAESDQLREAIEKFGVMEHYWLFAIFIAVVHSLIEEIYWRWFVFGGLRKLVPLPAAHGIAALGFTAHHVLVLHQFFPSGLAWLLSSMVAVGGLIWTWSYQRQRSLAGIWLSHGLVDLGIMILGWLILKG